VLHLASTCKYLYMLRSPIVLATTTSTASSHALRGVDRRRKPKKLAPDPDEFAMDDDMYDDDFDEGGGDDGESGKGRNKSRRELPTGAVATLKAWLLSPDHFAHPYPTPQDQAMLMQKTGIDKKQLKNWFTNARRRIWKSLLKKQIETGKLSGTVPSGFTGMGGPNGMPPSAGATMDNPHSVQAVRVHYQQAMQDQASQQIQVRFARYTFHLFAWMPVLPPESLLGCAGRRLREPDVYRCHGSVFWLH
jgi:Homeobox KN domain